MSDDRLAIEEADLRVVDGQRDRCHRGGYLPQDLAGFGVDGLELVRLALPRPEIAGAVSFAPTVVVLLVVVEQLAVGIDRGRVVQVGWRRPSLEFDAIDRFERHEAEVERTGVWATQRNVVEHHVDLVARGSSNAETERHPLSTGAYDPRARGFLQELLRRLSDDAISNGDLAPRSGGIERIGNGCVNGDWPQPGGVLF